MDINIHEFAKKFSEEYGFLYDNDDRVAGYREAVDTFDEFLKNDIGGFKKFVSEFCNFRKDLVSSDREAAAFMFALESMKNARTRSS